MFVNPNNVLNKLELKPDMTAADFGCGSGGWVLPLAGILEDGAVFAVDAQEEPISALQGKARHQGLKNITTITADLEARVEGIKDGRLDLVVIANVLFQLEDKAAIFREAKRVLKSSGELLVVGWKTEPAIGPKQGRISKQEVQKIAQNLGFRPKRDLEQETGIYHYGLVFTKP